MDIIQLLPDHIANQIAAGEVIQRPASAVKELMENAVDSGADNVVLQIKEAGKTLIQVIDNGCGMSETDARLCFERHATSKLKTLDDLYAIKSYGFRGEAMPSMAAVAQIELKTKTEHQELGTRIAIEGSQMKAQNPCQMPNGTNISLKNLFYNVPARRNFLKSNAIELKNILDEFIRVALAYPDIAFGLTNDDKEVYKLKNGTLRQRIVALFGSNYESQLASVSEDTSILKVSGYIGKPEFSRKTRGLQFFFVNNRYIKDHYLSHAIQRAYEQLLPEGFFPLYVLHLDIEPKEIDINVHPNKTEIKFQNEKSVYAILFSAVKKSLSQYNISPSLDFTQEVSFNRYLDQPTHPLLAGKHSFVQPEVKINANYNPFELEKQHKNPTDYASKSTKKWEELYEISFNKLLNKQHDTNNFTQADPAISQTQNADYTAQTQPKNEQTEPLKTVFDNTPPQSFEDLVIIDRPKNNLLIDSEAIENKKELYQLHKKYILSPIRSGLMLVEQNLAHQRILYEKYLKHTEKHPTQALLFPETLAFDARDALILIEMLEDTKQLGFDIEHFGQNTFVIRSKPIAMANTTVDKLLQDIVEQAKYNAPDFKTHKTEKMAQTLAKHTAIKTGTTLTQTEMTTIVDELFACQIPYFSPDGKTIITTIDLQELN